MALTKTRQMVLMLDVKESAWTPMFENMSAVAKSLSHFPEKMHLHVLPCLLTSAIVVLVSTLSYKVEEHTN